MGLCQLSVGFLVPRQCENEATGACSTCGRAICSLHASASAGATQCTVCASGTGQYFDPNTMFDPNRDHILSGTDQGLFNAPSDEDDQDLS